jgi:hypothetical protein
MDRAILAEDFLESNSAASNESHGEDVKQAIHGQPGNA